MGDKQIHPPHGQGAFEPVGPSGDGVQGQVTGVVGRDPYQEWLQKGLDGEDVRIRELQNKLNEPGIKGTQNEKDIERYIKEHLQARQWYIDQADRVGVTLVQNGVPVGLGRKLLKAMAFLCFGLMLIGAGFLCFRSLGSGELVADTTALDETVDEAPETESDSPDEGETRQQDEGDPEGTQSEDGPVVIVVDRPVEQAAEPEDNSGETQTTTHTTEVTYEEHEPVQEESMQPAEPADAEMQSEEPADEGVSNDPEYVPTEDDD